MIGFGPVGFGWRERYGNHGTMLFRFPEGVLSVSVNGYYGRVTVQVCLPEKGDKDSASVTWDTKAPEWLVLADLADSLCHEESRWRSEHLDQLMEPMLQIEGYLDPREEGSRLVDHEDLERARHRKAMDSLLPEKTCPVSVSMLICMIESDIFGVSGLPRAGQLEVALESGVTGRISNPEREWLGGGSVPDLWQVQSALERVRRVLAETKEELASEGSWEPEAAALVKRDRRSRKMMKERLSGGNP